MARRGIYRHNVEVTGTDDATKQVSKNAWNDDLNRTGLMGFAPSTATIVISSGALLVSDTWTVVESETSPTADSLTHLTTTDTLTEDIVLLVAGSGEDITLVHEAGGAGQLHLLSGANKALGENVPVLLIRRGADWYEFGGSGSATTTFADDVFAIQDEGDPAKQMLVSLGGATSTFDTTLTFVHTGDRAITFPDASTTLAGLGVAQTFTATNTFASLIHTGRHQYDKGADVASAGTITLGADGNVFDITGTTTINEITPTNWQAGSVVILQFDGALTVTHNSGGTNDILLAGATNFTTATGNTLTLFFNGTDWVEIARNASAGGGSDTPWTANHDFNTYYFDMEQQSAPSNPSADNVRFYVKTIDANNDGLFVKVKKAGAFVELQVF